MHRYNLKPGHHLQFLCRIPATILSPVNIYKFYVSTALLFRAQDYPVTMRPIKTRVYLKCKETSISSCKAALQGQKSITLTPQTNCILSGSHVRHSKTLLQFEREIVPLFTAYN
jgi:hypothetical protein